MYDLHEDSVLKPLVGFPRHSRILSAALDLAEKVWDIGSTYERWTDREVFRCIVCGATSDIKRGPDGIVSDVEEAVHLSGCQLAKYEKERLLATVK
jgi:D-tyrosyl-tRNA(Tyr) deacylase